MFLCLFQNVSTRSSSSLFWTWYSSSFEWFCWRLWDYDDSDITFWRHNAPAKAAPEQPLEKGQAVILVGEQWGLDGGDGWSRSAGFFSDFAEWVM